MTYTKSMRLANVVFLAALLSACVGFGDKRGANESRNADGSETGAEYSSEDPRARARAESDYIMALGLIRNGKIKHAKKILNSLVEKHPTYSGPYANLGILHQKAGELKEAEQAFLKAIELKPENAVVYNRLGMLYREMGKFKKAATSYGKALSVDADYAEAYMNMGILYDMYLHDPDKALAFYADYQRLVDGRDEQVAVWIADLERRGHHLTQADANK